MRAHRTVLTGATLAGITLAGLAVATPRTAHAAADPTTRALQYMATFQTANGAVDASFGSGITEDTVIGLADAGNDPAALHSTSGKSPLDYLAANVGAETATAGGTAKLILAVVAAHGDPTAFGSTNLVTTLAAFVTIAGDFGASPTTFTQALGIIADVTAGHAVPAKAVSELVKQQLGDGAWGASAFTPNGESNSTAIALMALRATATPLSSLPHDPLAYLATLQDSGGGFSFTPSNGGPDADSSALVIEGLVAAGQNINGAPWVKPGGQTPLVGLLALQDAATGGFDFQAGQTPDDFTTSQVPAGILAMPYGTTTRFTSGVILPAAAPGPMPTPTATRTPSPTAAATPSAPSQAVRGVGRFGGAPPASVVSAEASETSVAAPLGAAAAGLLGTVALLGAVQRRRGTARRER